MKDKGRIAWLITWEGDDAEHNGRCKVVAVLPSQLGEGSISSIIRVLFHSESNLTLGEKFIGNHSIRNDPLFCQQYKDRNPELNYGLFGKSYLCARKVKNLRVEECKSDMAENTMYWTELPKFIPHPDLDPNGPLPDNPADWIKQIRGGKEGSYTYSIQPSLDENKRRRAAFLEREV